MGRLVKSGGKKPGSSPGTLVHVGKRKTDGVRISIIDYDENKITEKKVDKVSDCFPFKSTPTVTWVNIDGLSQVNVIEELGRHFNIHSLILEDILNTGQRPKTEDFGDYVYIVLKMLSYDKDNDKVLSEQVSLILGPNYVLSFQERPGDTFDPVRERIRAGKGKIRKSGADYLTYALVDTVIDNYFVILERIEDKLEGMEAAVLDEPTPETLQEIHRIKNEMIYLRKSVWPLREAVGRLEKIESDIIAESTRIYIRDVYDHTIQVIDTIDAMKDMSGGLVDTYLSTVSNRMTEVSNKMNEVMKVLTIFASIFIPLTFIAGVYGMNFEHMPELGWKYGYYLVWAVMIGTTATMLSYFRKKGWL